MDFGGYLWLVIDVAMVAVLAAAMIYGIAKWRRSRLTRAEKDRQEDAVDDMYEREHHHHSAGAGPPKS